MAHLNVYVDENTANYLRESAKKQHVSVSHVINTLIQKSLTIEENAEGLEDLLKHPKFLTAFKKLLMFSTENLALTRYVVEHLANENAEHVNQSMLQKARAHAEGFVAGLLDET